jgi:hypothetical protein
MLQTPIEENIHTYLERHQRKELLRFLTCGSVDDGKSTLIGRLLHDSRQIYEDQLAAVKRDSIKMGTTGGDIDLALLTDGLKAEREQGITIDVAYRYFSTDRRKFIIAGHARPRTIHAQHGDRGVQLPTRNHPDRRPHGVMTQTRRHSFIVALLASSMSSSPSTRWTWLDILRKSLARFATITADSSQSSEFPTCSSFPSRLSKVITSLKRAPPCPGIRARRC